MQPVALTGRGCESCMLLTRLYCPDDYSSQLRKRSRAATTHGCMSVENLQSQHHIIHERHRSAKKHSAKRASDEEGCIYFGNEGSWQAFLLSVNKCDIQCAARV